MERVDHLLKFVRTPHIEIPVNHRYVTIDGYSAYAYVSPEEVDRHVQNFSERMDLNWYDQIFINMNGGIVFAADLIKLQKYTGKVRLIEYHPDGRVPKPIPAEFRDQKIAVIDDILDTGATAKLIREHFPDAAMLCLVRKKSKDQTNKDEVQNSACAFEVDNKWLLGRGMNGDTKGDGLPENWGRGYRGIAYKIEDH